MRKPLRRFALTLSLTAPMLGAACGGGGEDGDIVSPFPTNTATSTATATPTTIPPSPTPIVRFATLERARQNLRAGAYADAAAEYRALALNEGDDQLVAEAWLGAGIATYLEGDLAAALVDLEHAFASGVGTGSERRIAYLYGLRLVEAGQYARAAEVLAGFAAGDDVLAPYIHATYAAALAGDGRIDAAAESWDAALAHPRTTPGVKVAIYRARADAALAAGDPAAAVVWLRQSVGVAATPEKRYELGTLAGSLGDSETFRAQLSAVLIEAPGTPWAESALADLQAAGYSVDAGQAGYVHYRRRNYEDAREILAVAVDEPGITAEDRAFRTYYLAAAYEDDGYAAAAIPLYDSIAGIAPSSPYVHRAKYWAARATEVAGSAIDASTRYVDLVNDPVGGEFTRESAFRAGFVLLDAGDAGGAVQQWDSLEVELDGRMLYWRGRAQELVDPTAARQTFEQAAAQDPISFYGQAAAVRIGQASVPGGAYSGPVEFQPIDWDAIATWIEPGATALFPADSAARQLAELGLIREAEALLQQEVAARNLTRLQFLGYIRAAHEAGLTSLTARWATQFAAGSSDVPDDLARLSFPIDYVDLLNQAGEEHDVDPLFLAALIRQESYWDAAAVSVASARGLTQVIPATGSSIAAALGYGDWAVGDLFLPAISLEFGAYYIGAQLDRFGSPLAALSAYNGGPGNAVQWLANAASGDPADYVEAVTFSETRGYVVIVMENYARYRALYR